MFAPWKNSCVKPRQCFKKQRHHFAGKSPYSQTYGFSSSHVWMWELDHKEGWELDNWFFWTVVLEKTLESPLDCKEIKPVNPKGNQSWIYIGRTDDEAEAPILWSPVSKSWFIGKDPDAGKNWGQEENRGWDSWMTSLTQWTWVWGNSMYRGGVVNGVTKNWTGLSAWTTATKRNNFILLIIHTLMDGARYTIEF